MTKSWPLGLREMASSMARIRSASSPLARSGALPLGDVLEQLQRPATQRNRDIAQSLLWAFGGLRPLVTDRLRPNWERWLGKLFSAHLEALGLAARPQDSDDMLRLRPALVDFLAAEGSESSLNAEVRRLAMRELTVFGSSIYPNVQFDEMTEFIKRHDVKLDAIVSHQFPLEEGPTAYEIAAEANSGKVCFRFD